MLKGGLRGAVRFITDREKGGVFLPTDIDEKSGKLVKDVLLAKHPNPREPGPAALKNYPKLPEFVSLDVTEDIMEKTLRNLSDSAGLGGMDSLTLKYLLLQHGGASR